MRDTTLLRRTKAKYPASPLWLVVVKPEGHDPVRTFVHAPTEGKATTNALLDDALPRLHGERITYDAEPFVTGRRYRIRHRFDAQRRERESVMTYLGSTPYDTTELQFDARPAGGTQTLRVGQIKAIRPVPNTEPHNIDGRK